MNQEDLPPEEQDPPRVSGYIEDAVADVMRDVAEKAIARDDALAPLDQPPSAVPWIVFGVLTLLSLYLWFGSPGFLAPSEAQPVPPALADAGLRMEVFLQALNVEEYLAEEGRLPNSLMEAGDPFSAVEYERLDRRRYRLWVQGPTGILELMSADSLWGGFLGDAPEVVMGGWR